MTRHHRLLHGAVAAAAGMLLLLWGLTHVTQISAAPDTLIRLVLTGVFALLIILRPKPGTSAPPIKVGLVVAAGMAGAMLHVTGIVFTIHQAEWLGLLAVAGACLAWSLPAHYAYDTVKALALLYFAHPLPAQILGALQITMQQMSVTGAERLLHILNVRVWADGLVLKTGMHIFEIPAWCSGMRTATTVFLLALGLGLIKRLDWYQKILVVVLALLQALALNILRISLMVFLVPALSTIDDVGFLHDTAGVIVIAAVFLVYFEIELFRRFKVKTDIRADELTPELDTILRESPPFWRRVVDHPFMIACGVLMVLAVALAVYKQRPHHRAAMYRGVTEAMRDTRHLADAERLGWEVRSLLPDDDQWISTMLRLLVMRAKYREVLDRIETLPAASGTRALEHQILQAYSLMGLNRRREARAIIDRMPAEVRDEDPRVAMILAEMAFYADEPDEVARRVIKAAQWGPNLGRIRALYPYLRVARKWDVISSTDPRTGYRDPAQALSAAEAFMNLDLVIDVAVLARRALNEWPQDPRLLVPLFYLAGKRPDEGWEQRYAAHLRRCLPVMEDPDMLYGMVENTIQLRRPDLAWSIYGRIEAIDPTYPGLAMMAVRYGQHWFDFRRRYLGIPSGSAWESINVTPYFQVGRLTPIWSDICDTVPMGPALAASNTVPIRKEIHARVLNLFATRDAENRLSLTMQYEYAFACEIDQDIDAAQEILKTIAQDHPDEAETARIELSAMYERSGDWQNVYETLRTYPDDVRRPRLRALLRLTTAQLNLNLGLGAVRTATVAVRHHPNAGEAAAALSLVLGDYDSPESALNALSRDILFRTPALEMLEAEALFRTQRFAEYRRLKQEALLPLPPVRTDAPQGYTLPPAELAVNWHLVFVPTKQEFARHAARLRERRPQTTSPFLRDLYTIWLACHDQDPPVRLLAPRSWTAIARDPTEEAIAMSQLCMLLCYRRQYDAAYAAAEAGAAARPELAIHWRYLIGLSGADPAIIARAREACPADSEIWLAWLLAQCRDGLADPEQPPERPRLEQAIDNAVAPNGMTAATLTRAAELLLRAGYSHLAAVAAHQATQDARTLLPAYIVGLRCAVLAGDRAWAEFCTVNALRSALQPPPALYRRLVEIKLDDGTLDLDDDMVDALKRLRRSDPDNTIWPRILALVRFKRGGWEVIDSLNQAAAALQAGATDRMLYIVGAEAARLLRNQDRAVELLQQGLRRYPGDTVMLNNLACTLADTPGRKAEALDIVPELLQRTAASPWLIDTIALVYLRNNRLDEAEQALGWIDPEPEPESPAAFCYTRSPPFLIHFEVFSATRFPPLYRPIHA